MFNQTDQDNHDTPTTLSLREDPEPALQKAREQASRQRYSGLIGGAIGGIGLVVVLTLPYVVYNDYLAHKQELPALIARGRRIPAQLSGEPVRVGGRYQYTPEWLCLANIPTIRDSPTQTLPPHTKRRRLPSR